MKPAPRHALVAAPVVLAALLAAGPAHAQSNRRFQQYVQQAGQAYERGDADGAIAALQHAYEIRALPVLLFNIGRAHELAGRLATAIEYYDRFLATDPDPAQAQTARDTRANAQTALDRRNNPPPRETAQTTPAPAPAPTPHPANPRHVTVVHGALVGGGAAALIAGGVLGGLALSASSQFASDTTRDPMHLAMLQDQGNAYAWGADVALGVGVIAVVAGIVLYLTQDTHADASPALAPTPTGTARGGTRTTARREGEREP